MTKENNNVVVTKDTYFVYGGESCANCKQAVTLLNKNNLPFVYKTYGKDYEISELIEILPTPSRSIPQVFYVGTDNTLRYVGGLMELVKHLRVTN